MRKVIRADLRRILRKPAFYILVVIGLILMVMIRKADTASEQVESLKTSLSGISFFLISIPTFLGVYTDEFKSGSMINIIGGGLSRKKVIIAKLIDVAIIFLAYYAVLYIIILIKNTTAGIAVTPKQNLFLLLYALFCVIKGVGYFAVASLMVFATWAPAGGMVVLLILVTVFKFLLTNIQDKINLPIYNLSFPGLLDNAFVNIQAGNFGWQLIPALLIYVCGIVFLTMLIFNRKELDL